MKPQSVLLVLAVLGLLWLRHENTRLTRSFERANKVADVQKSAIGMLKNQLSVSRHIAITNEAAQVRLGDELAAVGALAARRERSISRLMNENETLRRWSGNKLPDVVRRLHARAGCASAAHCLQPLPESESVPDAGEPTRH